MCSKDNVRIKHQRARQCTGSDQFYNDLKILEMNSFYNSDKIDYPSVNFNFKQQQLGVFQAVLRIILTKENLLSNKTEKITCKLKNFSKFE